MRLCVLTTDTPHHRYFLRRIAEELPAEAEIVLTVLEERPYPWRRRALRRFVRSLPNLWDGIALNEYIRSPAIMRAQAAFEDAHFFPDGDRRLPDVFPTIRIHSINELTAGSFGKAPIDLFLVYGTGKIRRHVFERPSLGTINAHGGLLPDYRGLDTNLWAALEGRPEDMAVTIHQIEDDFDTGPVYLMRRFGQIPGLSIANLRYYATLLCTKLFLDVVQQFLAGTATTTTQQARGRYFGPMPALLQRRAAKAIRAYAAGSEKPAPRTV